MKNSKPDKNVKNDEGVDPELTMEEIAEENALARHLRPLADQAWVAWSKCNAREERKARRTPKSPHGKARR